MSVCGVGGGRAGQKAGGQATPVGRRVGGRVVPSVERKSRMPQRCALTQLGQPHWSPAALPNEHHPRAETATKRLLPQHVPAAPCLPAPHGTVNEGPRDPLLLVPRPPSPPSARGGSRGSLRPPPRTGRTLLRGGPCPPAPRPRSATTPSPPRRVAPSPGGIVGDPSLPLRHLRHGCGAAACAASWLWRGGMRCVMAVARRHAPRVPHPRTSQPPPLLGLRHRHSSVCVGSAHAFGRRRWRVARF